MLHVVMVSHRPTGRVENVPSERLGAHLERKPTQRRALNDLPPLSRLAREERSRKYGEDKL